jgi:hypothetical protein
MNLSKNEKLTDVTEIKSSFIKKKRKIILLNFILRIFNICLLIYINLFIHYFFKFTF